MNGNNAMRSTPSIARMTRSADRLLRPQAGILAVYLLGSAATQRMRADSDIDLAVLIEPGVSLPLARRLELAAQLELELGRPVDIGVVEARNLVYAGEAILGGRRIVTVDAERVAHTESRLLGCYLSFREDRRGVEEAYHAA